MAEKKPLNEENKKSTKTTQKKIATGNTKKAVSARKSSVAGKAEAKKSNTSTAKKASSTKKASTTKTSTAKASTTKLAGTTTKTINNKKTAASTTKKTATTKKTPKKVEENIEVVNEVVEIEKVAPKETKVAKKSTTTKKTASTKLAKTTTKKTNSKNENVKKEVEPKEEIKKSEEKVENRADVEKNEKVSIQSKKHDEIAEVVSKELKANRKMPKVELDKINSKIFPNIVLAVAVVLYLIFVILGFMNIEGSVFVTDLKVFSIALLIVSIGVFEYAYRKDSGRYAIHGIEVLLLAFITMTLIYVNLIWSSKLIGVVAIIIFAYSIYYVTKSIVIYNKMKKHYFMNEMKEIIKNK